jgi:hypothetical protein
MAYAMLKPPPFCPNLGLLHEPAKICFGLEYAIVLGGYILSLPARRSTQAVLVLVKGKVVTVHDTKAVNAKYESGRRPEPGWPPTGGGGIPYPAGN